MTLTVKFLEGLRQTEKRGRECFIFSDVKEGSKRSVKWTELLEEEDIIVLYRDLRWYDGLYTTTYYFTFEDEELAESYRAMMKL